MDQDTIELMARSLQQRMATRLRESEAAQLRMQGFTYEDIALALGYSDRSGARKAVERAVSNLGREEAEEVRRLQYERLNGMLAAVYPAATTRGGRSLHQAVRSSLAVMDQIDRLWGLDAGPPEPPKAPGRTAAIIVIDGPDPPPRSA